VKGIKSKVAALMYQAVPWLLQWNMVIFDLAWTCLYFPAIMACIMTLPLDEILKTVVPHVAIKYFLDFILIVNNSQW
jgi:hypothetical protein